MRRGWRFLAVTLVALAVGGRAVAAAEPSAARKAYDEATAAFGLGRYAEAAEKYEAAFSLRPDPALLYDAAQAYRLAGNRARALELYRNYLRLYPDRQNADEARNHVAALSKAIEDEKSGPPAPPVATAPETSPPPLETAPPPPETAPPPPAVPPALVPQPPPAPGPAAMLAEPPTAEPPAAVPPANGRSWIWIAVGAAVVVGGAVAVVLATRGDKFPDATFGTAAGN
jgi:tetratricopeptide (TPR) repeat protein